MALEYQIDSLDGLDETVAALYSEADDGKFVLGVKGVAPKAKLDEFRNNNIELLKRLEQVEKKYKPFDDAGIDLDEWAELKETKRKVEEKELLAKGDIDAVVEQRLDAYKKDWMKKEQQYRGGAESLEQQLKQLLVVNKLQEAAAKNGVEDTAIDDVIARGERVFVIRDGQPVAMQGDQRLTDGEGNELTPEAFVRGLAKTAPHLFKGSAGSGARGSNAGGVNGKRVITRAQFDALGSAEKRRIADALRKSEVELHD